MSLGFRGVDSELVVQGVGEVRAMPDLASVRVSVDGEGQSRDEAYQMASSAATAVDAVLINFEAAIAQIADMNARAFSLTADGDAESVTDDDLFFIQNGP